MVLGLTVVAVALVTVCLTIWVLWTYGLLDRPEPRVEIRTVERLIEKSEPAKGPLGGEPLTIRFLDTRGRCVGTTAMPRYQRKTTMRRGQAVFQVSSVSPEGCDYRLVGVEPDGR